MQTLGDNLRIIFDAYELIPGQGKSIGIYKYAKNLLEAMLQLVDDNIEIIVICNALNSPDFTHQHKSISTIIISTNAPGKFSRLLWIYGRAATIVKKYKADVYFSPKGILPKGIKLLSAQTKTVVVIHDLIPLWYAEHFLGYFGWLEELFINQWITSSAKFADSVIAISKSTADDILNRLGRKSGVSIVYNGIPHCQAGPRPLNDAYIFAMASKFPHKNTQGVLNAYSAYRNQVINPLPLVMCGLSASNEPGVITITGINDATLHAYYAYAELFICLSLIEGFGFPPAEALAHGTTVICSDIPSLREISKDLAVYVPLNNPNAVGQQIIEALKTKITPELIKERTAIINEYTWQKCAEGVLFVIRQL